MAVFLDFLRLHQLAATTRLRIDKTSSVGYIFSHVFSLMTSNEIKQLHSSVMDAIGDRSEGIAPSHGITHK